MTQALAWADALVLPPWREGLPNAMIEATATGGRSSGSIPDMLADGRDGSPVPLHDVGALVVSLISMIDNLVLQDLLVLTQ